MAFLLLLIIATAYGQGIICNHSADYACTCRNEVYPTCDTYVTPNHPLTTVLIEVDKPPAGEFEAVFKKQVTQVVGTHCNKTNECEGSLVTPKNIVLLTIYGNTVEFVIIHVSSMHYHLRNEYLLDSNMVVRLLVQAQFRNVRAIRTGIKYAKLVYPIEDKITNSEEVQVIPVSAIETQEEIKQTAEQLGYPVETQNSEQVSKKQTIEQETAEKHTPDDGIWPYVAGGFGIVSLMGSGFAIYKYRNI